MSLRIGVGSETEIETVAPGLVRWQDLSRHPNRKACKPWAQQLSGTHDKYGVDGDWLDRQTIDDDVCFDVGDLVPGDLLKVSGASHNNKKAAYLEIQSTSNGALGVRRISEADAIESLADEDDELDELRARIMDSVHGCEDVEILRRIETVLGGDDD